jgi:hypothetical protein
MGVLALASGLQVDCSCPLGSANCSFALFRAVDLVALAGEVEIVLHRCLHFLDFWQVWIGHLVLFGLLSVICELLIHPLQGFRPASSSTGM